MRTLAPLAVALLACLPAPVVAQDARDLERLERRGEVYLDPSTGRPYDGRVVRTWDGVGVRQRGALRNGRWDGLVEYFHLNGRLAAKETYRNGLLHGPAEAYFKSGQLSIRETYLEGELHGPYESYWFNRAEPIPRRVAERGAWATGRPCGEWLSYGQARSYPPCMASGR